MNGNTLQAASNIFNGLVSLSKMIYDYFMRNKKESVKVDFQLGKEVGKIEMYIVQFPSLCNTLEEASSNLYDNLPVNDELDAVKLEEAMQLASQVADQLRAMKEYQRILEGFLSGCTRLNKNKIVDKVALFAEVCAKLDSNLQEIKVCLKRRSIPVEGLVKKFDTAYREVATSHREIIICVGELNAAGTRSEQKQK